MTTTKQLIEYLKKFPEDTKVKNLESVLYGCEYESEFVDLELPENAYYHHRTLFIGSEKYNE